MGRNHRGTAGGRSVGSVDMASGKRLRLLGDHRISHTVTMPSPVVLVPGARGSADSWGPARWRLLRFSEDYDIRSTCSCQHPTATALRKGMARHVPSRGPRSPIAARLATSDGPPCPSHSSGTLFALFRLSDDTSSDTTAKRTRMKAKQRLLTLLYLGVLSTVSG